MGGDVYSLPAGSKVLVKDKQKVTEGEKLAETLTICEHGGEVRVGSDLVIEDDKFDGKKIKKIVSGKELTIVIASLSPANASFDLKFKLGEQTKTLKITAHNNGSSYCHIDSLLITKKYVYHSDFFSSQFVSGASDNKGTRELDADSVSFGP